jgi:UDP-glucose 4-epimerase
MVLPRFAQQSVLGEDLTVYGDGDQTRCFCHVADVVGGIVALLDESAAVGDVFNIGGKTEVSIVELAKRVIQQSGSASTIRYVPYQEAYEAGFEDMRRRVPDTTRIRQLVGWEPRTSLDQIIAEVVAEAAAALDTDEVVAPWST